MTVESRGTSNTNDRGSAETRRRRKRWLFEIWAADVVLVEWSYVEGIGRDGQTFFEELPIGKDWSTVPGYVGQKPLVRCFRHGGVLTWEEVECDRIIPGAEGGKYTKRNIRPVCGPCNKILAGEWVKRRNAKRKARNAAARARRAAVKSQIAMDRMLMENLGVRMDGA